MMNRCESSRGNMVGLCSCGVFQCQFHHFSMPNHKSNYDHEGDTSSFPFTPSSSSVDCTLSLGTPGSRTTDDDEKRVRQGLRSGSCVTNLCWDLLGPTSQKASRGGSNNDTSDPLLARRCANCDTTSTPLWRNGPRGPKSLCNACGIRFKKEERRASAAAAAAATNSTSTAREQSHMVGHMSSWLGQHPPQTQKIPYLSQAFSNEFRFMNDDNNRPEPDSRISFFPWCLNVRDTGLVHDFTR